MRVFIALELPEDFAAETSALARVIKEHVEGRFMRPESYHLTLAFLGDIEERTLGRAVEAIKAACKRKAPVTLSSSGLGRFGRTSDATLWMGVTENAGIMSLASDVREELAAREVPFDTKAFKPHITLARRVRIPRTKLPPLPFPRPDVARRVTVFKSELSPEGATYTPLHTTEWE